MEIYFTLHVLRTLISEIHISTIRTMSMSVHRAFCWQYSWERFSFTEDILYICTVRFVDSIVKTNLISIVLYFLLFQRTNSSCRLQDYTSTNSRIIPEGEVDDCGDIQQNDVRSDRYVFPVSCSSLSTISYTCTRWGSSYMSIMFMAK